MVKILNIKAREIKNSKGKATLEVVLNTEIGEVLASVPSGVSTGKYEAVEKSAKDAVKNVEKVISPKLVGQDVIQQKKVDDLLIKLDGTENKSSLGANAILGVSIAVLRAGARAKKMSIFEWISKLAKTKAKMPLPGVLCVEGGLHAKKGMSTQEIMVVPQDKSFKKNFDIGKRVYSTLGYLLEKQYGKAGIATGAEGAFTPPIKKTEKALDLLMKVVKKEKVGLFLDVAATSFFKKDKYQFEDKVLDQKGLLSVYSYFLKKYPIVLLEDPFAEEDWSGFSMWNLKKIVVGDDLTVTNVERMKKAKGLVSGVIIKPNQVGTVTETLDAVQLARSFGWKVIVSHRAGETMDDFISDLAVGVGADFIKAGAPSAPERMAKYKRLLTIEKEL